MNRRNLFKSLASLIVGAAAVPLAKLLPESKPKTWEISKSAFAEVTALENHVQSLTGYYSYTSAYLDKDGTILQPNYHVYRSET